jgi:hypothetical protein
VIFAERVALPLAHAMTRITTGEGLTLGPPIDAAECIFTLGYALEQLRQHLHVPDRCEAGRGAVGLSSQSARTARNSRMTDEIVNQFAATLTTINVQTTEMSLS